MIVFNNNLSFSIEKSDRKVRLIVHSGASELVCRKTKPSEIKKLLQTDGTNLFKGRLQLIRAEEDVIIKVKGKQAGIISLNDFLLQYHKALQN